MRTVTRFAVGFVLAASLATANYAGSAQGKKTGTPTYQVVRLTFPGAAVGTTWAYDLNDRGIAVGEYEDTSGTLYGFHYQSSTDSYQSLGAGNIARGVNQLDEVVGTDTIAGVGLYWNSPDAEPVVLNPLPGHTHSQAVALNDSGIIIGSSYIPEDAPVTPGFRAIVVWYVNPQGAVHGPVVLPFLEGDIEGRPSDLTEAQNGVTTVVGSSESSDSPLPVTWMVMVVGDSPEVLGPVQFDGSYVQANAYGINNFGDAVGGAALGAGMPGMAFQRRAGQPVLPLPILPNAYSGIATDINDAGLMVGGQGITIKNHGATTHGVYWRNSSTVADLNSLVSLGRTESFTWALRINGRGDILAIINGKTPCVMIAR